MLSTDAASNRVTVGSAAQLERSSVRLRGARLHRDASRVDSVHLRHHAPRRRCRVESFEPDGAATLSLEEPADAVAPARSPV